MTMGKSVEQSFIRVYVRSTRAYGTNLFRVDMEPCVHVRRTEATATGPVRLAEKMVNVDVVANLL